MSPLLEVHDLNISYGTKNIVKNFHLKVEKGQFVALTGRNGSGKSTVLKALLGIIPFEGHIHLNTKRIGYLPQSYLIDRSFPITVRGFLELACLNEKSVQQPKKNQTRDLKEEIEEILKKMHLNELSHFYLNELSQGQFQKVLFARSLLNSPELLILDEPLSNIDETSAIELKNILIQLNQNGTGILLTIHDSLFVKENCHSIYSLSEQKALEQGFIDLCLHPSGEAN